MGMGVCVNSEGNISQEKILSGIAQKGKITISIIISIIVVYHCYMVLLYALKRCFWHWGKKGLNFPELGGEGGAGQFGQCPKENIFF